MMYSSDLLKTVQNPYYLDL